MGRYILKRCVIAVVTVLVLVTIIFVLVRLLPGDPFTSEKTNEAIKEKMMGFTTSNTTPCMVPTGALQVMIGSNPISAGFPADPYPFLLDISTCAVAGGKIDLYAKLGKDLDPSWTLGKDGKHHFSTTLSEHNAFLASGDYGG